ncbi:MAG: DUF5107 domain-containing protein [Prolixibacteraceae bacterium]
MNVKVWKEDVVIPTYEIGEPEKNPVFLEKRVYQGSSGVVYPYPVIEKIYDEKIDKIWKAIFLENEFLKIMILPELGGRVQMAFDKIKQRHFVYYNQVIKPALVGLAGPWISGGIEFNWPQHHRPSTYSPVDSSIQENSDGSVTVWCSEIERMFRTKGMAGFTLHPDKAYLEIKVKLFNRTPHPQTFLWWANPAVKVNDHYQSVFPPDVHAVFDHGKRDVSTFPIATGTYYKVDYSKGVDISKYKNIPVPTSYMAIQSNYDFIGCYENDSKGGMLHVANHHLSPGKKQWTWGNSDFGEAWDRNLTDEDGPYIELMCGVYTDNQPDFSWLMPYEEKTFSQYFMPYHSVGLVKNATKDVLINLEFQNNKISIKVYATSAFPASCIQLNCKGETIYESNYNLNPSNVFDMELPLHGNAEEWEYHLIVFDENGKRLIAWNPEKPHKKTIPEAAKAAKSPQQIEHVEQLFLRGLHLEQYRHATFSPVDYYTEALCRDPGDVRCNNAMGLLELKKGNFAKAISYFERAIATLIERNPNPYDGEPYFNLGLALRFTGNNTAAYSAFYKATWNQAWQGAAYFQLGQLASKNGNITEALDLVDQSLIRQWHNHQARHLKLALLRKNKQTEHIQPFIGECLKIDSFNFGVLYEKYLLSNNTMDLLVMKEVLRGNIHSYIEVSLDYFHSGMTLEALELLNLGIQEQQDSIYPMVWYYMAWYYNHLKNNSEAKACYIKAEEAEPGTCFPNQLEAVQALNDAINTLDEAPKAAYYLGNFYYNKREYSKAINYWEVSVKQDPNFPTSHRNLALAYYNKAQKPKEAVQKLGKAFALNTSDARVFMELDALYKRLNYSFSFRLELMEKFSDLVNFRDDVYLEKISLLNFTGKHEEAYAGIMQRKFHPWEGGEGKVTEQYVMALLEGAKTAFNNKNYLVAIDQLKKAREYPHNLGEGKLPGAQENDLFYWLGCCYEKLNNLQEATSYWELAATGISDPSNAMFYNDQQPDKIFYQGLALQKLSKPEEAALRFDKLINYGQEHLHDEVKMDYFAVSFPDLMIWDDDLNARNQLHCNYLMALGFLGKGKTKEAKTLFKNVLSADLYHSGSHLHLKMIDHI